MLSRGRLIYPGRVGRADLPPRSRSNGGQVVDGIGGTAGPIGWQAAGALDGEVAFLSGHISKAALFQGGVTTLVARDPGRTAVASEAYAEGAIKAVRQSATRLLRLGLFCYQVVTALNLNWLNG